MQDITIDIETRSDIDLNRCGVYKYAESELFDVLLISYSVDGGEVNTCDVINGELLPDEIIYALADEKIIKRAFNVNFERICLSVYLRRYYSEAVGLEDHVGNYLPPISWQCDMIHGRYLGMPSSLKQVGSLLRLGKQKMSEGKELIKLFCTLQTDGNGVGFMEKEDAPKKWKQFKEYNKRDVETELEIQGLLSESPVPDTVWKEFYIDQRINDRGILVDTAYAEKAVELDGSEKQRLTDKLKELTSLDNPKSVSQMKEWLSTKGVRAESLDKKAVSEILDTANDEVKEVLTIYQQVNKTSVKKYETALDVVCDDNRARGMFSFYGANRTGRFAGRLIQLQNLPQNHLDDLAVIKERIKSGEFDSIRSEYDDITDVLSQLIRTSFIPKEGMKFVVADFAAIEARVIAWLAWEQWRMEAFRNGEDIYCASASKMFGVPVVKNGENGHLRQKGKIAELACGYGGSVGAIKAMGGTELKQTDEQLLDLVNDWRKASPNIVRFWSDVGSAAEKAVLSKGSYELGNIKFTYDMGILFIELPSKRRLSYIRPKAELNEQGQKVITYEGVGENKKWIRLETYGAKLVENITQGVARYLLLNSMNALSGYDIVGHVHDEVIVECSKETTVQQVCGLMEQTPEWAEGLLLRADGYECDFYMKA